MDYKGDTSESQDTERGHCSGSGKMTVKVVRVERRGRLVMYVNVWWRGLAEGLMERRRKRSKENS